MSHTGQDILKAVRQVRQFHGEVGSLLSTATAMMDKKGWTGASGNIAVAGGSQVIYASHLWGPQTAFRFFKQPKRPNILAFVSVIIDDVDKPERMTEPLVSAGFCDYGKDGKSASIWDYDYARLHLDMPQRRDDGTPCSADPRKELPKVKHPIEKVVTFAIPLTAITNTSELQTRIIDPLLAVVGKDSEQT